MFSKDTYIRRRAELKKIVGEGVIVLFGNNDAPCNYPANCYAPMRQDSSFLYYFGQHRNGLVGVIDIDNDEEWLFGDDIDVEDIVWMGFTPSVADLAAEVGVTKTAPMKSLTTHLSARPLVACTARIFSLFTLPFYFSLCIMAFVYWRSTSLRSAGTFTFSSNCLPCSK